MERRFHSLFPNGVVPGLRSNYVKETEFLLATVSFTAQTSCAAVRA